MHVDAELYHYEQADAAVVTNPFSKPLGNLISLIDCKSLGVYFFPSQEQIQLRL